MSIKVKDLLPLIWYNDIRLVVANEEVCLIRKDFNKKILSDKYLNMEVECIENAECIEHCATAKAYGKFREAGIMTKMEAVEENIIKSTKEKDNVEKGVN